MGIGQIKNPNIFTIFYRAHVYAMRHKHRKFVLCFKSWEYIYQCNLLYYIQGDCGFNALYVSLLTCGGYIKF